MNKQKKNKYILLGIFCLIIIVGFFYIPIFLSKNFTQFAQEKSLTACACGSTPAHLISVKRVLKKYKENYGKYPNFETFESMRDDFLKEDISKIEDYEGPVNYGNKEIYLRKPFIEDFETDRDPLQYIDLNFKPKANDLGRLGYRDLEGEEYILFTINYLKEENIYYPMVVHSTQGDGFFR